MKPRVNIETATASASELARFSPNELPDGIETPLEDKPIPVKMPRSFSLEDDESCSTQRIWIIVSFLLVVYAVVMSTYAAIVIGQLYQSNQSCKCSPDDVQSAFAKQSAFGSENSNSGFCNLVEDCVGAVDNPTTNPSRYPSIRSSIAPSEYPSPDPSLDPTRDPSTAPTTEPTYEPTLEPTQEPTLEPTMPTGKPSSSPTTEPTTEPTLEPTTEPTLQPSARPTVFDEYFIGDYKMSAREDNHGYWALCDGSALPIDGAYSLLFAVIGYSFGAYNDSNGTTHFQLPNVSDSVLGIGGKSHPIGEQSGEEAITLSYTQLPKHTHATVIYGQSGDGTSSYSNKGLCNYYFGNWGYHLRVCNGLPNTYSTGYQWQGYGTNPVSVMQPTSFISNLFIYTGVQI